MCKLDSGFATHAVSWNSSGEGGRVVGGGEGGLDFIFNVGDDVVRSIGIWRRGSQEK